MIVDPTGRLTVSVKFDEFSAAGSQPVAPPVVPLHTQHFKMLQRNLLYTGLTRGRRLVVVVGSRQALELAVRHQDTARRYSMLGERLRKAAEAAE